MKTICFTNGKGGVGKTTLAVHTAYALATYYGQRVLLADFDRQWQATKSLGLPSGEGASTFVISGGQRLEDCVTKARPNLWVLSGSEMTQAIDVAMAASRKPNTHLRSLFGYYDNLYDVLIIDTAAHGYLNEMSVIAADLVAVPTPARHMDADGLQIFTTLWSDAARKANMTPPDVSLIPNMVDNRTAVTSDILDVLGASLVQVQAMGWQMAPRIPISAKLGPAFDQGKTIFELKRAANMAAVIQALRDLADHLAGRVGIEVIAVTGK